MKHAKILSLLMAGSLFFSISCRNDDNNDIQVDPVVNNILIANEGNFGKANASVSRSTMDFSLITDNIYSTQNNGEPLGDVLQHIGFSGDKAYLVVNNSNKIEIVNRETFKKTATVTSNLVQPRYIAFSGNNYYVTNNNFFDVKKVNIYSKADNSYQKSITFPNYADKIEEAGGFIYIQTDGTGYDASYNELPTGHTVTRLNPSTNAVDKTITLPDTAIIRDMVSGNGMLYVLTSDNANSYLYKITGSTGDAQQVAMKGIAGASKLALDNGQLYFITNANKVYNMAANATAAPSASFTVTAKSVYGFNVINGNVMISDSDFMNNSTVRVYSTTGNLLKTFTAGIGTNGFYKN